MKSKQEIERMINNAKELNKRAEKIVKNAKRLFLK